MRTQMQRVTCDVGVNHQLDEKRTQTESVRSENGVKHHGRQKRTQTESVGAFLALEQARTKAGIPICRLCAEAGVHHTTYQRWRDGETTPTGRTQARLKGALARLGDAQRDGILPAFARLLMRQVAAACGADPDLMSRQDFSRERPANAVWLRAAELRRYTIAIMVSEFAMSYAAAGRAVGCTRQGVLQAVRYTENAREADAALDARLTALAHLFMRREE